MDISIVIPAFEESRKITRDIQAAAQFIESNDFDGEIIVVDDGSTDDTAEIARSVSVSGKVSTEVIRYEQNRGKGYAVRSGISKSSGQYVIFADSGSCVPYDDALNGLAMLESGDCDIAHGSRKIVGSDIRKSQAWHRRLSSTIFRYLVLSIMRVGADLTDTQCGFKIYKGDIARELYSLCQSDGFMFDIEIIIRAQKKGYRIKEFGIRWTCDPDSRLSLAKTLWPVIAELTAIKRATASP